MEASEGFDFGLPEQYEGEQVAEKVLWPLVDSVWGADWRESSNPHETLRFPKPGEREGRDISVVLRADHTIQTVYERAEHGGGDDEREHHLSFHEVQLSVSEIVPDWARGAAFSLVRAAFIETFAPEDFDEEEIARKQDEEPEEEPELDADGFPVEDEDDSSYDELEGFLEQLNWLDENQNEMTIEQGISFESNSEGRVCTNLRRVAWLGNHVINVPAFSGELHQEAFDVDYFSAVDLDTIEVACRTLGAPSPIHSAIAEFRGEAEQSR